MSHLVKIFVYAKSKWVRVIVLSREMQIFVNSCKKIKFCKKHFIVCNEHKLIAKYKKKSGTPLGVAETHLFIAFYESPVSYKHNCNYLFQCYNFMYEICLPIL